MSSQRVIRTQKGSSMMGGHHLHIEALCLDTGRTVAKATAIYNIKYGLETYYTLVDGYRADVDVASQCSRCYSEYLRTNRDSTTRNNLLDLPNC